MTEQHTGDRSGHQTGPRRTFHPGSWYAVQGAHTSVLLPPSLKSRVAAVWEVVDGGACFYEVLDVLISQGLRELPGFVLIGESDGTTQVLLRGAVTATVTSSAGEVFLDGASASTWVEQSAHKVNRLVVELEDIGHCESSPLHAGLVRVGRIELVGDDSSAGAAVEAPAEPESEPEPEPLPVVDLAVVAAIDAEAAAGGGREEDAGSVQDAHQDEADPADPADPVGAAQPLDPVDIAPLDTEDLTGIETAGVTTQAAIPVPEPIGSEQEPTEPLPPPRADSEAGDHDGSTRSGTPSGDYDRAQPGIPGQQHPPSVVSRPVARLLVSNGDVVEVDRVVLVGRAPEGRRLSLSEQPALVTVASPLQEISSTHLEVRPGSGADHGSAVVTDLGSTNGTVLVQPGLPPESMQPGNAVQLIPGAVIDLGDGVTIQVTNV